MKSTIRFAVGERNGLKSSIWTITSKKSDIYLFSRLFGSDFKLSLHASGDAQWSFTSEFVTRQIGMLNKDRHFIKWNFCKPLHEMAINIFRIQIPHTELRNIPCPTNKKVKWVSGITSGTYQFDFCITKPSDTNPCVGRDNLPHKVLDCIQMEDKRWLVIFIRAVGLTQGDLQNAKTKALSEAKDKSVDINKADWIALFGTGDDGVPLVIELHYDNPLNSCNTY